MDPQLITCKVGDKLMDVDAFKGKIANGTQHDIQACGKFHLLRW